MSGLLNFYPASFGKFGRSGAGLIFIKIASSIMKKLYRGVISMKQCINL